jgi:hypothetical protein
MYVVYVSSGCCKSRSCVAYVAMAIHVCCKCMFQMLQLFQTYVPSVLSGYCICCSSYILPLSLKASIPRIRAGQTFLSLTDFIEKMNNIYDIK